MAFSTRPLGFDGYRPAESLSAVDGEHPAAANLRATSAEVISADSSRIWVRMSFSFFILRKYAFYVLLASKKYGYFVSKVRKTRNILKSVAKLRRETFSIIGTNIAALRRKTGLNQDAFADEVGVAPSSLKDIERGVAEGHVETASA